MTERRPVMDLSEFVLARIAEDLAQVTAEGRVHGFQGQIGRALAECEAKRRILAWKNYEGVDPRFLREYMLRALALPYATHPDYGPAWTA